MASAIDRGTDGLSVLVPQIFPNFVCLMVLATFITGFNVSSLEGIGRHYLPTSTELQYDLPEPVNIDAYLKTVNDLSEFEYLLDTTNRTLLKEYDFVSTDLLALMATKAKRTNTTPEKFIEEIQEMVISRSPIKTRTDDFGLTNDPMFQNKVVFVPRGLRSENETDLWHSITSDGKLKQLEIKYNITGDCCKPDSVTYSRLLLMFPHFLNLGQIPFANSSTVEIPMSGGQPLSVPAFFTYPEFAGLIPTTGPGRKEIISIHMYSLYKGEEGSVPFRTKCKLVNLRMEKSLATNARRIRYLQNNNVLTRNGDATSLIKNLFQKVPGTSDNKIYWDMFGL